MKPKYFLTGLIMLLIIFSSCKKYLDAKPDKKLVVPTSVEDLQGILDYHYFMNDQSSEASEIASDNYYLTEDGYLSLPHDRMRSAYLWKRDIFTGMTPTDWQNEYTVVYNANVVLDNIDKILRDASNSSSWDNCKGSALVYRAKSFYEVAQIWTIAYDSTTAASDLGIPLRITSDFNVPSIRSSIQATYNQIISDLQASIKLLPNNPLHPYRPSKAAAYGYLARTYLAMRSYNKAKLYADSCLQLNNHLIDYNNIDSSLFMPFANVTFTNPENIMHSICWLGNYNLAFIWGRVDSLLYQSYETNDLRKSIFFAQGSDGGYYYRGSYDATNIFNYNGIATDEMYLIRAECFAREGNLSLAITDLNSLLSKRWRTGTFTPVIAVDASEALGKILVERRKELVYRMLRFGDIKRLNKEGANITMKRIIQGQVYTLPPNDPRYALPIPNDVIQTSGIQQNPGW